MKICCEDPLSIRKSSDGQSGKSTGKDPTPAVVSPTDPITIHVTGHTIVVIGDRITLPNHDLRAEIAHIVLGGTPCPCVAYALFLEDTYHYPNQRTILDSLDNAAFARVFKGMEYVTLPTESPTGWLSHPLRLVEGTPQ